VPRITTQELKEKLDANEDVIVVDARSRTEYDSVHIPGALSIPLAEIEERHGELPQEGEIVLYCTWPAEQTSARAALKLYELGFTEVRALWGGLHAWQVAGYPVEVRWDAGNSY
jgi:rhodanese-related sulfurtransferase